MIVLLRTHLPVLLSLRLLRILRLVNSRRLVDSFAQNFCLELFRRLPSRRMHGVVVEADCIERRVNLSPVEHTLEVVWQRSLFLDGAVPCVVTCGDCIRTYSCMDMRIRGS